MHSEGSAFALVLAGWNSLQIRTNKTLNSSFKTNGNNKNQPNPRPTHPCQFHAFDCTAGSLCQLVGNGVERCHLLQAELPAGITGVKVFATRPPAIVLPLNFAEAVNIEFGAPSSGAGAQGGSWCHSNFHPSQNLHLPNSLAIDVCQSVEVVSFPTMQEVPLITYSEFIIILLTAITIILAALGVAFAVASVVLGFLGFIGYKELIEKAEKRVDAVIARYPKPEVLEAQMYSALKEAKDKLLATPIPTETNIALGASDRMAGLGAAPVASVEPAVKPEPTGAVSSPYPEKEGGAEK